jgi:predicted dehydrogenase
MPGTVRWGLLATGAIARQFAQGLRSAPGAELVAVGSRTREAAERFGAEFGVPHRHASYQAVAEDPEVDVVYIGTPHNLHCDNTLMCLEAGKPVLCEKPFAINASQAERMVAQARSKRLFLMEALWTRYLPAMIELRRLFAAGTIGPIRMIEADFGFRPEYDPLGRLYNPDLGGGALLDIGIYPISLTAMLLGLPARMTAMAELGRTGVDERSGILFGYPGGELAVLTFSLTTDMPSEILVLGTEGWIRVHGPIYRPEKLTVSLKSMRGARDEREIPLPVKGNGYNYEAVEVMRCLREGRLESPGMTLDESLAIMRLMDGIRAQWGLRYPGE